MIEFVKNLEKISQKYFTQSLKGRLSKTVDELLRYSLQNGIEVYRVFPNKSIYILRKGDRLIWIHKALTSTANTIGVNIARDKNLAKVVLKKLGYPVANGQAISSVDQLDLDNIAFPVVVKPLNSSEGRGITVNITNKELLVESIGAAKKISKNILVEEHIGGDYYRLTYVANGACAVVKNLPAYIVGDGNATANELIAKENECNKERGIKCRLKKIKITEKTIRFLASAGYQLDSVIEKNERIPLCFGGFDGGEYIDVTDEVHPYFIEMAKQVTNVLSIPIVGIDIVATSISNPLDETGGVVIEINGTFPDIQIHAHPTKGKSRNLAPDLVEFLFKY